MFFFDRHPTKTIYFFYDPFLTLEYCRKISPSFQFCSDRIPGGRQGGIEKKQWPRERVGSNSVGKIAELYNSQNQQAINQYQCYVDRKELSRGKCLDKLWGEINTYLPILYQVFSSFVFNVVHSKSCDARASLNL